MGTETKAIIDGHRTSAPEIYPFAEKFNNSVGAINAAFMNGPASPLTKKIEDSDARRDAAVVDFSFVVRGYSYNSDAAEEENRRGTLPVHFHL